MADIFSKADMFSKVISIASYNFKHKHKLVIKNTPSVPYYVFNNIKATVKSFFQKKSEFFFLHHIMQLFMTFPKN